MTIRGGKLEIAGAAALDLPVGQWVHFDVSAALGKGNSGTWNLTVTLPGQEPKRFEARKNGNTSFEELTWLGFVSNATAQTVFYLDNLKIDNQ